MSEYAIPIRKFINNLAVYRLGEFNARDYHLVHSPDDNGWYWQRCNDWSTSQLFITNVDAIDTMKEELDNPGTLVWDD